MFVHACRGVFVHACRGVFGSMIQQKMCVKVCKSKKCFCSSLLYPSVRMYVCTLVYSAKTHKRMHACAIRNRTCVQCEYCRLGFGMVAWDAGKTVTETGTWSCCDAACCVQAQRNTLQESEHSERKKGRKKEHVRRTQKRLSYIQALSFLLMELMQQ